ncbi:MAG: hypothetical protein SAJ37_09285, partial [Oscillatoria sp. PMC 1068.18]|nr:hypothetical protein [Oscillatoria sp. PMC 1068.18]
MSQLTQALEVILKWNSKHYPLTVTNLNPGLSYAEIKTITKNWSIQIPTEIYELYQWRNGVGDGSKSCEFAGIFDCWGFLPLQDITVEKQPGIDEYEARYKINYPHNSLNLFFGFEWFYKGYAVISEKGKIKWIEFGEVIDGGWEIIDHYNSLTSMMLTIAECYENAYYVDSLGYLSKDQEKTAKIRQKYYHNTYS